MALPVTVVPEDTVLLLEAIYKPRIILDLLLKSKATAEAKHN